MSVLSTMDRVYGLNRAGESNAHIARHFFSSILQFDIKSENLEKLDFVFM